MLSYSFENLNGITLYEHLYNCIKKDIHDSVLLPGTKLPSKRSIATNLGISVITVENAYAQLLAEGYIYSLPRKGFYVSDIQPTYHNGNPNNYEFESNSDINEEPLFADFTSNQTDSDYFPFSTWTRLLRKTINEKKNDLMCNAPVNGCKELRTAIANHLRQFRNMNVHPDQLVIGAGTEYLYGLIIQLLGHNKKYAVENPGYKKISRIYESNQVECKYIDIDKYGIKTDELLKENADVIHISPSHHFPTGIIMPIQRRHEILKWAMEKDGRYIIEDEYDSEFRFSGQMIPTLQSIDKNEKVIYINTFTKSLSSTVRMSYMVLPPHLVSAFKEKLSFYSSPVSNFEQFTLAAFISEGYFEKHINRMRNYYHTQRDLLLDTIEKNPLSAMISISEENSGLHFLMKINTTLEDTEIMSRALKMGIKITSLSQYYENNNNISHTFIINYSSLKKENMEEAINRLYLCIK